MSVLLQCRDVMALLTEEQEGALHGVTALTFGIHLKGCRPCSRYKRQVERGLELLAALPLPPAASADVDRILAVLEAAKKG